jgi:hypothetical protein
MMIISLGRSAVIHVIIRNIQHILSNKSLLRALIPDLCVSDSINLVRRSLEKRRAAIKQVRITSDILEHSSLSSIISSDLTSIKLFAHSHPPVMSKKGLSLDEKKIKSEHPLTHSPALLASFGLKDSIEEILIVVFCSQTVVLEIFHETVSSRFPSNT